MDRNKNEHVAGREPRVRSIKRERMRYFHKNIFQILLEETLERQRGREKENPNFSSILGVPLVGSHRAKN